MDDCGSAILGTANGRSSPYMLGQHITALGPKTINMVHVFSNDEGRLSLAFHVVDYTPSVPTCKEISGN